MCHRACSRVSVCLSVCLNGLPLANYLCFFFFFFFFFNCAAFNSSELNHHAALCCLYLFESSLHVFCLLFFPFVCLHCLLTRRTLQILLLFSENVQCSFSLSLRSFSRHDRRMHELCTACCALPPPPPPPPVQQHLTSITAVLVFLAVLLLLLAVVPCLCFLLISFYSSSSADRSVITIIAAVFTFHSC